VRQIRLAYRAQFRQPTGALNPMGLKLAIPVDVEVFEAKIGQWTLRSPVTNAVFTELPACASATEARRQAAANFTEQIGDWQPFHGCEPILPADFVIKDDGKAYLLEAEDFTHILAPGQAASRKDAPTLCGRTLPHRYFANRDQGPPPTCRICAAQLRVLTT